MSTTHNTGRPASFDSLEPRVFYSASLKDGTLKIRGTPQDDAFVVTRTGSQITVDHNGKREGSFAASKVARFSIVLGDGNDSLQSKGKLPRMMVDAGAGDDTVQTSAGNDSVDAGPGVDRVNTYGGNDDVDGGTGNDYLDGGTGINTIDYSKRTTGVTIMVDPRGGTADTADGEHDQLVNFSVAMGGSGNDVIKGSANGIEQLYGNGGNDTLTAVGMGDELYGGDGDDDLQAGYGSELLDGGAGSDTADFSQRPSTGDGVYASLADGYAVGLNVAGERIDIFDCENLIGTPLEDYLVGDDNSNTIDGGAGPDTILGKGGPDTLLGGDGNDYIESTNGKIDTIDGGTGTDYAAPDLNVFPFGVTSKDNVTNIEQIGAPKAIPMA